MRSSQKEFEKTLEKASRLRQKRHHIKFTHGDLKAHNVLVGNDGHLAELIDWESGGWYPEYRELTTAMRFGSRSWWDQVMTWMGGDRYWRN